MSRWQMLHDVDVQLPVSEHAKRRTTDRQRIRDRTARLSKRLRPVVLRRLKKLNHSIRAGKV